MQHIKIISVGKLKEKFYKDACDEYAKRLSRFIKLEMCELLDEKAPETLSEAQRNTIVAIEGERILARTDGFLIALDVMGEKADTLSFTHMLAKSTQTSSKISFAIGGSLGLSRAVLDKADVRLSLSDMTFCHSLARVMLLEQLYRSFKIMNNQPYHK